MAQQQTKRGIPHLRRIAWTPCNTSLPFFNCSLNDLATEAILLLRGSTASSWPASLAADRRGSSTRRNWSAFMWSKCCRIPLGTKLLSNPVKRDFYWWVSIHFWDAVLAVGADHCIFPANASALSPAGAAGTPRGW